MVSSPTFRVPSERGAVRAPVRQQDDYDDPEAAAAQAQEAAAAYQRAAADMTERLASSVELLRLTGDRLGAEARGDALEVAVLVARRILEAEISVNVESMVALVRSAIRRLGESRRITVRLNPEDAEAINGILTSRGQAAVAGTGVAHIEIVVDPALERGDSVVEGEFGSVDGRLGTRMEELRRALEEHALEEIS